MSNIFAVFYYYYYVFYTKVIPEKEPHATVIFTLSVTESLIANSILKISFAYYANGWYTKWVDISVFVTILIANYLLLMKSGRGKKIITEEPKLLKSKTLSISVTILFFLIGILYLFFGPIIIKQILATS